MRLSPLAVAAVVLRAIYPLVCSYTAPGMGNRLSIFSASCEQGKLLGGWA